MSQTWQPGHVVASPTARYALDRPLGEGGFAETWLAKREGDGLPVALKSLHIRRLKSWKSLELFERETQVLRRLDHPQIPDYVDHFTLGDDPEQPDGWVLAQQYVDGQPLSEAVAGRMAMDEARLVSVMAQLLEILGYLHRQTPPVIHRDVTPKNVLVDGAGKAWLVDFGTVQAAVRSASEVSSTSAGTFGYAPMEQFVGAAFPSSDLYGLAMTVLAVASGKQPADMPFAGVRVDVRALLDVDARLVLLLERMTEPDPERRLDDAGLALAQLRPLVHRWAGRGGADASALQAVAERARGARAAGPRASDDDLLPSERIREAGLRMAAIGGDALPIPEMKGVANWAPHAAVAASGEWLGLGRHVLRGRDLTVVGWLRKEHHAAAFDAAGERVAARDEGSWRDGHVHVYARDTAVKSGFRHLSHIETEHDDPHVALSPDGRLLCLAHEAETALYEVDSGQQTQRFAGTWHTAHFTPDGGVLVLVDRDAEKAKLLLGSGEEVTIGDVSAVALSIDGAWLAVLGEKGVRLHQLSSPRQAAGSAFGPKGKRWRGAAISPDGRWLVGMNYRDDRLELFDLEQRTHAQTLRDPNRPDRTIGSPGALGFDPTGERLLAHCRLYWSRYVDDDERVLGVWHTDGGAYLGCGLLHDDDEAALWVSARGWWGDAPGQKKRKGAADAWRRPDVAQGALLGRPVDELLDEHARAQLADVEARWRFAKELKAGGAVDPATLLPDVVQATRGLTHVLDAVVREARAAQQQAATFGGGAKAVALTADRLRQAGDALRGRGKGELDVIHEQLLAEAEAAELAEAERIAARRRPRVQRSRRREVAAPARELDQVANALAEPAQPQARLSLVLIGAAAGIIAGLAAVIALLL